MKNFFSLLILVLGSFGSVVWADDTPVRDMTWEEFNTLYETEDNLKVTVDRVALDGLYIDHRQFTLFIPLEELVRNIDTTQRDSKVLQELGRFEDRDMIVRIILLDEETETITLSEEIAYLDQLTPNSDDVDFFGEETTKNAVVTHVDPFGVFVKLDDTQQRGKTSEKFIQSGNFHISEGTDPRKIFTPGQQIEIQKTGGLKFAIRKIFNAITGNNNQNNSNQNSGSGPGNNSGGSNSNSSGNQSSGSNSSSGNNGSNSSGLPGSSNSSSGSGGSSGGSSGSGPNISGSASGSAGTGTGAAGSANAGGKQNKREERELRVKKRHEDLYECVFELPEEKDCYEKDGKKEQVFRDYAIESWNAEYEDYRALLEDLYYDNNCTWQDIVAILFSEKDEEIKCEQRITEDLEEVGIEQEKPSRINRYITCVEMIPETVFEPCYEHYRGRLTSTRYIRLQEGMEAVAKEVRRHGLFLTEVMFEERFKRRELIAAQEEVYHRSDQLWQKLTHMNYNYLKEVQEFSFKFQPFVKCIERAQVAINWIKEKSRIF